MPSFPRYESQRQLTTQQPSALAVTDKSAVATEALGKAAGQVQEVATKWQQSLIAIQKTTAESNFKMGMLDIENRASNDPNYNNSSDYFKEIEALKENSLKGFSSPLAKSEMSMQLDLDAKVGTIRVDNMYKKKIAYEGQGQLIKLIDAYTKNPEPQSLQRINQKIDYNQQHGIITADDAQTLKIKANEDLGKNRIQNDLFMAQTVEQAKQIQENIRNGYYEQGGVSLSAQDKSALLTSAGVKQRQIGVQNRYEQRVKREQRTHDLIQMANNGVLEAATLEEAFFNKEIANSTYTKLRDYTTSIVGPTAETVPAVYNQLIETMLENPDKVEQNRNMLLEANSKGELSREDLSKIYSMHFGGYPSIQEAMQDDGKADFAKVKADEEKRLQTLKDKNNVLKSAYKMISGVFTGANKDEFILDAIRNVYSNVMNNNLETKDIIPAAEAEIGKNNLLKHPEWANLPKTGVKGKDRYGNQVTVYPDGRVVPA